LPASRLSQMYIKGWNTGYDHFKFFLLKVKWRIKAFKAFGGHCLNQILPNGGIGADKLREYLAASKLLGVEVLDRSTDL